MAKSNNIVLGRLRNAAYMQFQTDFMGAVDEFTPEALKIAHLYGAFQQLHAKADLIFKKILKSRITEQMQEADKARDEVWRGLLDAISSSLRHFDPAKRAAAKQLNIVRKTYGDVARMTYNGQTAATDNFVQDMEGPYAQHVATVGLSPWIVELKARNIAFTNLARDRNHESSLKNLTLLREARTELDAAFYVITKRINALAEVEGTAAYESFILELNVIIAKYNILVAKSLKRDKKGEEDEEELEDTQTNGGSDE